MDGDFRLGGGATSYEVRSTSLGKVMVRKRRKERDGADVWSLSKGLFDTRLCSSIYLGARANLIKT